MLVAACSGGSDATTTTVDPVPGFSRLAVTVSDEEWSVAVANTPELRQQGLMGVTDLGALDGMLFIFESDVSTGFWMKNTLIPLEIAFFGADGVLVDLLRMTPCEADPCPIYEPSGPYRYAIETEVGRWDAINQPSLVLGEY